MNILTPTEITKLYEEFVKCNHTDEYKLRYHPLPIHKNNKSWKWEGKDFPRIISLLEFDRYVQKYKFNIDKLLTFDGINDPETEYLDGKYKQILDIKYTDNPEKYDLHNLQIKHDNFDFVCLHQTLEHIYNPFTCLTNIKKYMSNNGYLYINVPALSPPHSDPLHFYTGYTLMGLLSICKQCGFEIKEAGQWGNREYLGRLYGITGQQWWADYTMLKNPGINEVDCPIIVWALIQNKN